MDGEADNEVFVSEDEVVMANQFLHELPSYQSLVRRKPSNYGTMDSHKSNRNLKRSLSREPSRLESTEDDFSIPLRERPISIQEKRNLRKIQTLHSQNTTGWNQLKDNSRSVYQKFKDDTSALLANLQLWRSNIHNIEGKDLLCKSRILYQQNTKSEHTIHQTLKQMGSSERPHWHFINGKVQLIKWPVSVCLEMGTYSICKHHVPLDTGNI